MSVIPEYAERAVQVLVNNPDHVYTSDTFAEAVGITQKEAGYWLAGRVRAGANVHTRVRNIYVGTCPRCGTKYRLELAAPSGIVPPPKLDLGCSNCPGPPAKTQPFLALFRFVA